MFERAILHPGFSVVETLSERTMFYPGAFNDGNPRKGDAFEPVDEETQEMDSIEAAMGLTTDLSPGKFGVYYEAKRPTKNELAREWLADAQSKIGNATQKDLLHRRFASMR